MRAAMLSAALSAITVVSGPLAYGQDYPAGVQVLHGTIDNDSLTIRCDPPAGNRMHCSFAQTMVSRPADYVHFEDTLQKSIDDALSPDQLKGCEGIVGTAHALRTGEVPNVVNDPTKFHQWLATLKPEHRADLVNEMELYEAFCANPTREGAEIALRATRNRDLKTCKIHTNAYQQNFVTSNGGKTWISNEGPAGQCGVIYISKFEKAKSEFSFWTYTTQKVVTNKDADPILNICSSLDERVIFYDWSGSEKYLNCTYIEFGY